MATNVKINGVTYSSVPSVDIPKADGSGNAKFYDTADATATAGSILSGSSAYIAGGKTDGTIATKTASDITMNGKVATLPTGYYNGVTKTVASGTANATEADVMSGVKFYDNNLNLKTGTASVPTVSQDGTSKVLSIR